MPVLIPNARVNIQHIDGTVDTNVAVSIQPPKDEVVAAQGGIISREIHIDPRIQMTQGDTITVTSLYGHPVLEQVSVTITAYPKRVAGLIPYISVEVSGVYL